jgi:hypothetical protein
MAKYSRTTITVPPDLKARMDAVEEPINWSAVAAAAFEQKLAEIVRRRGAKDMREAIARLRASKARFVEQEFKQGREAGRAWAMNRAEAAELERLAAFVERCGLDWDGLFDRAGTDAYSAGERIVFAILPEDDGDRGASHCFWEMNAGDPDLAMRPEFVRGFAEGAVELWDEIRDQL